MILFVATLGAAAFLGLNGLNAEAAAIKKEEAMKSFMMACFEGCRKKIVRQKLALKGLWFRHVSMRQYQNSHSGSQSPVVSQLEFSYTTPLFMKSFFMKLDQSTFDSDGE